MVELRATQKVVMHATKYTKTLEEGTQHNWAPLFFFTVVVWIGIQSVFDLGVPKTAAHVVPTTADAVAKCVAANGE